MKLINKIIEFFVFLFKKDKVIVDKFVLDAFIDSYNQKEKELIEAKRVALKAKRVLNGATLDIEKEYLKEKLELLKKIEQVEKQKEVLYKGFKELLSVKVADKTLSPNEGHSILANMYVELDAIEIREDIQKESEKERPQTLKELKEEIDKFDFKEVERRFDNYIDSTFSTRA